MKPFREITVDGRSPVYIRNDDNGQALADRYTWDALAQGAVSAASVPVDRVPQGAERLDAPNRRGGKSYR